MRDIIRSFPEADHHVVLGAQSDPLRARSELAAATLTLVPSVVREPSPAKDLRGLSELTRRLRETPVDLVVTHQSKAGVLGRVAARLAGGVPTIHSLSMASFGPGYPKWQDRLFRAIEARLEGATAAYAVVGHDLARRYEEIGVPHNKLHVVRSGVSLPGPAHRTAAARSEVRAMHGIPEERPVVLYLGSLEPRKNVLQLGPLLQQILTMNGTARPYLTVGGEGPLAGELVGMLRRAGLERDAKYLGFVPDPRALIAAADAVVLLSAVEGLPQALVQAAAAGTPFVAYSADGVRELMAMGARGTEVQPGDISGAASALSRIIGSTPQAGPPSIDLADWSSEAISRGYRQIIDSVLARQGRLATGTDGERAA